MEYNPGCEDATRLAQSIVEFTKTSGLSRTSIYEAIKARQLKVRKFGRRSLILTSDGKAFLDSLPTL